MSPCNYMELSKTEKEIINILRELRPFESVKLVKDQNGKPDHYFVERTQKIVISN